MIVEHSAQIDDFISNATNLMNLKRKTYCYKPSFQCEYCPATFETHQSFVNHAHKMHSEKKRKTKWVCQHCNTCFSGSRTLRDHITITHSSNKPQIPCPVTSCLKVFLTAKRMKAHLRVHDDDAKEMCNECGLLVTSTYNLEKHIKRVHLRLRNFFCDLCGYSATFKHSINSHMVSLLHNFWMKY